MSWCNPLPVAIVCTALGAFTWHFGAPPSAAGQNSCALDDALSRAAANLLLSGASLEAASLNAAVREAGSDAVFLHARFGTASDAVATQKWLAEQGTRADADLICGQADSESGRLLITSARGGSLAAIDPRSRVVRGDLAAGFTRAELVIAAGDGSLQRLAASAETLLRGIPLDLALPLPLKVQLVAHGPSGPRPIAERTLEQASTSGATLMGSTDAAASAVSVVSSSAAEPFVAVGDDLATLLSELRRARGRPRLRVNRLLHEVAETHAQSVCREGRVAHELGQSGDPQARLAKAGLSARLVGEAIARATDAAEAFAALQRSPSHLLTVLEPRFTDIGIGRARDAQGKSCFVVLLCAWPRATVVR